MTPFPWSALPKVAKGDAEAARAMRRWAARCARVDAVGEALSSLLGARVTVRVASARAVSHASAMREGVAVLVADADAPAGALLEAETALATALVARAIRRPAPGIADTTHAPGAVLAGALGAVVAAAARRVSQPGAHLRVVAAGNAAELAQDFAARAGGAPLLEARLAVRVDEEAFDARVLLPRALATRAADAPWSAASLAAMGEALLAVPIVACVSRAVATDVGALRKGDAWLPGAWPLRPTATGALAGPVLLAPGGSETGLRADLGEDGRLVLRGGVQGLAWTEEDDVTDAKDALVEAVGEVPVVVRVEVGVAEMRAREWAALAPGDVFAVGRKIGDPVTLRVGGVAMARGELVDLDGEIGVRILGRAEER